MRAVPPSEAAAAPTNTEPDPEAEARARRAKKRKRVWASPDISRLSKHSWMAGLAGAFTVLYMGYLAWSKDALKKGWGLRAGDVDQNLSMAFVLVVVAAVMLAVELIIRFQVDAGRVVKKSPLVERGEWGRFLGECLLVYAVELGLLTVVFGFYKVAGEYGWKAQKGGGYYKPWFTLMPYIWDVYVYGGLPYILLTRALQHDAKSDKKQAAFVVMKAARMLAARLRGDKSEKREKFDRFDKSSVLGLLVKFFFVPLMTVFFVDQFSHLVGNFGFLLGGARNGFSVRDFHNVSYTIVFSVDVGLAWCGYVLSSRWIKNSIFSAEPTALGWLVAVLSYPPINRNFGLYFMTPGENVFFSLSSPRIVSLLAVMSALSFTVYTSATVAFGLRFSNLTHRGIITTGPYSIVRHPAYAAKNFSWWCVMFPVALYDVYKQGAGALVYVLGLVALSFIYYMRARTEEKHLMRDPEYRKYMKKVPYRFIPGVI